MLSSQVPNASSKEMTMRSNNLKLFLAQLAGVESSRSPRLEADLNTPQATRTMGPSSDCGTNEIRSVSDLVLHGTTQNPVNTVASLFKLVQPAQTPDYASNAFFKGATSTHETKKFKPFQTYQSELKSSIGTQPSHRSGHQATTATEEIKEALALKIVEQPESHLNSQAQSSSRLKPEISKMHSEIMNLHAKIKQLEGQIAVKAPQTRSDNNSDNIAKTIQTPMQTQASKS